MFSEPVIGERFFGREEVLELLNKRVSALKDGYRQNIALTGQSLAGKSSVILHFISTIKEEGFIPIYVEVVKETFRSFANKFIATMLYNLLGKMGERVDVNIETLLDMAQKKAPKTYSAVKNINSLIDRQEFDEAYSDLLGLTSVLKSETGLPCIVILDEFDNLEHLGIKNPFMAFGKVIMLQKDTMYVVSSSRNEAIKKIISEKLSLLFGNFEVVKISNFGARKAKEFIDTKTAGFSMEDAIKKFLIVFSDGNPFYLDNITNRAREIAAGRMSGYINKDAVSEAVLELIYNANGIIHQYLLNFILDLLDSKTRDVAIPILISIANGNNKQPDIARNLKIKNGEVAKNLTVLLGVGLISKNGVFYKIEDAMLMFWLKFVYERRKNLLVDGTVDRCDIFREDIKAYISEFEREYDRPIASRIADLFNLFSNELVCIDSKNMRLPHFTKVEVKLAADSSAFIACSFRGNFWLVQPYEYYVTENDIVNYIKNVKASGCKISNKVIIPIKGIDENARLLAKELKLSIWDSLTINTILGLYGKKRIVVL